MVNWSVRMNQWYNPTIESKCNIEVATGRIGDVTVCWYQIAALLVKHDHVKEMCSLSRCGPRSCNVSKKHSKFSNHMLKVSLLSFLLNDSGSFNLTCLR